MSSSGSLYEVLNVPSNASQEEIRKAYRRACLMLHPDKNPGNQEAVSKFQSLQKIYAILGDPEKRKVYDQTGETDEDLMGDKFTEVYDYFRAMFKQVTPEDIDDFSDAYRGSEEEKADLLKHYTEFKGNMQQVFEWLMCSDEELDSHRFKDMIQAAIDEGKVKKYKPFTTWAKQVEQKPRPADPLAKKSRGGKSASTGSGALMQLREKRAKQADAFFDQLAEKYSSKPSGGKRKARAEPSEEEFAAIQERMGLRKSETEAKGKENASESQGSEKKSRTSKGGKQQGSKEAKQDVEEQGKAPQSGKKAKSSRK